MSKELMKRLQQIPLFAELSRDDIKAVARLVKRRRYEAGEVVCRQGQPGHSIYIVESGQLRILHIDPQGVEQEIGRLGPGDYFGETSLLLGEPRDATVEAIQSATLLSLSRDEFEPLLDERPAMRKKLQMRHDVARKYRARRSRFKWLDPDEAVIASEHRHNAILIRSIIIPCFALLVVIIGCAYWRSISEATLPLFAGLLLGFVLSLFILYLIIDHRDEIYIVTNKRVVRRQRTPLGRESRVDAPLRTIQDIQESQIGLLAQLYNFGDLIIETAGERGHVAFREIPDPEEVREIIFEQIHRLQAGAKVAEREAIREDLRRYFAVQVPEEETAEPPPPPQKQRARPTWAVWLLTPLRIFSYFLPPMRYEQGDTITWRKHWIALLKPIALPTLLIVVSTLIMFYLLFGTAYDWKLTLIGYGAALVILLPWWLWRFDDWQNDIYQVTATRIIDVERLPFYLREERREANLGMIQNVKFEIPSALGKLLNYGSVTIETAGAGAFTFDYVKDPRNVQAEIFRRMEAFQKRQDQATAERRRRELLDWFAVYDQMHRSTSSAGRPPPSHQQEA